MASGPIRLLESGVAGRLAARGHHTSTMNVAIEEDPAGDIAGSFAVNRRLASVVRRAVADRSLPIVLAGCCDSALGVVAGLALPDLAVAWFDAHGDFHTAETTPSGFLPGMALATLVGRGWATLAASVDGFRPVPEQGVALIGARAFERAEERSLGASAVTLVPAAAVSELDSHPWAPEGAPLLVHLDLDVLEPSEGTANEYAAPGGVGSAELVEAIASLGRRFRIAGAVIAAYDPRLDADGRVALIALSLIEAVADAAQA